MKISIIEEKCVGCGTCEIMCAQCFKMEDNVANVISQKCDDDECDVRIAVDSCPVDAIVVGE